MRNKNRSWRLNGRMALLYLFGLGSLLPLEDVAEAKEQQGATSVVRQESSTPKLSAGEYATDFGQGWYICPTSQTTCDMWNAYKVVNVDPYKNIQYQLGSLNLTFPKGRPTLTSSNGRFSLSLGMLMHYDMGGFLGPDKRYGQDVSGSRDFLRRGRFMVAARYDDFILTVSPDAGEFFNDTYHLFEASLKYVGFKNTVLNVGLLQPPSSMEDTESSNGYELIERPMVSDIVRNISGGEPRLALGGTHWGKKYYISAHVTGERLLTTIKNFQKNQVGGTLRTAIHPVATPDYDLHLGMSASFAFHGNNRKYAIATGPESQIWLSKNYIRTGTIDGVNSVWSIGPEVALRWKRLVVQSEYYRVSLQRVADETTHRPNLHFPGWYISTSYTIFGQPRSYDQKNAVFNAPTGSLFNPATGEWGALEWVARWSVMDLNSHINSYSPNGQLLGSYGGKQTAWLTGLNWSPSSHMRIMLNYNHIYASRSYGNSYNLNGRSSNLIVSRLQFTF